MHHSVPTTMTTTYLSCVQDQTCHQVCTKQGIHVPMAGEDIFVQNSDTSDVLFSLLSMATFAFTSQISQNISWNKHTVNTSVQSVCLLLHNTLLCT
jgi:hypothetical protein